MIDKLIVVGDRVLIKPKSVDQTTNAGLHLPPSVQENNKIQTGYVVKVGPGYPYPYTQDVDEVWKGKAEGVKYVPLQANVGDEALYLQSAATEIEYNNEKFYIVPQSSILLLIREDY